MGIYGDTDLHLLNRRRKARQPAAAKRDGETAAAAIRRGAAAGRVLARRLSASAAMSINTWKSRPRLVSTIWSTSGIHSLLALPAGMRYDAEFFYASVLPDIERNLYDGKPGKTLRGVYLHLETAPAHNAKPSRQEITRTKAIKVVHPAYFRDAAPSDFFLFGCLNGEMAGFITTSPADIFSEIRRIFQEISKETLVAVYDKWITPVEWTTEQKGKYHHTE
jgi:hypothetical protein